MKKGTKFLLIGGTLLTILGILIIVAGVSVIGPATFSKMVERGDFAVSMNNKNIDLFGFGIYEKGAGEENVILGEEARTLAKADEVKKIRVDLGGGILEILQSGEYEDYTIKYEGKNSGCRYMIDEGILEIDNTSLWRKLVHDDNQGRIILYVPKDADVEKLDIELGGGEMKVQNIRVTDANIDLGAGILTICDFVSEKLKVEIGAGEVNIKDSKTDDLSVDVAMGEIVYQGELLRDADVTCSMGEITLVLAGNKEDFNYSVDCSAGDVQIDKVSYSGLGVEQKVKNGAEKNIEVDCSMGNVNICFE